MGAPDHSIAEAIDNTLVRALGSDYALALRVCLDTSLALTDPLAYSFGLEEMLGHARARDTITMIEGKLHRQGESPPTTRRMHFEELMRNLEGIPTRRPRIEIR